MKRMVLGPLSVLALLLTMSVPASAQETIPVCIQGFEGTPGVKYLTEEIIADIEATVEDPRESASPKVVGYPDPATGSCATENGSLLEYDPEIYTPICVPSGAEGDGPLVVQFAINHYLSEDSGVIYADPDTGSCAEVDTSGSAPGGGDSDSGTDEGSTSELPDTGAGIITGDDQSALMIVLGFASVSALLFVGGLRTARRP